MAKQFLAWMLFPALLFVSASSSVDTVPAFLWSYNPSRSLNSGRENSVEYSIISPKELARNVLNNGRWSKILCKGERKEHFVDVALVFIGSQLHSADISRTRNTDTRLIDLLKESLKESEFSISFPYVSLSEEGGALPHSLISGFSKSCKEDFGNDTFAAEFDNLNSLVGRLTSRKKSKINDTRDLIFMYKNGYQSFEVPDKSHKGEDEAKILSDTLKSLKESGVSYMILYASDPLGTVPYLSLKRSDRQLIGDSTGNVSTSSLCDGVCQKKASLLEALFVGLVLLIILLSGLCCMSGIQSPKRFETPTE
eukprot:TRINITY_DN5275_c0_g1_i2.p1 TRINITY_DN5275_c0_g1~~TRINITY_DN5275_c0_g1_i2.p1  ORF type:complete len:310 (+),score=51.67 TRINITY_DN5275_c0_g1_i2:235-1164(+)